MRSLFALLVAGVIANPTVPRAAAPAPPRPASAPAAARAAPAPAVRPSGAPPSIRAAPPRQSAGPAAPAASTAVRPAPPRAGTVSPGVRPARSGGTVWSVLRLPQPPPMLPYYPYSAGYPYYPYWAFGVGIGVGFGLGWGWGYPTYPYYPDYYPPYAYYPPSAPCAVSAATGSRVRPARRRDASALDHGPVLPGRRVQRQRCRVARDKHRRVASRVPGQHRGGG